MSDVNVLLVGKSGNIGSRYHAILKVFQKKGDIKELVAVDTSDDHDVCDMICSDGCLSEMADKITHIVLATPTDKHIFHASDLIRFFKKSVILCEKPLSDDFYNVKICLPFDYSRVFVVNNWEYVARAFPNVKDCNLKTDVFYDFFKTGNEDFYSNMCQIIHLDPDANILTDSPVFNVKINGRRVDYSMVEESYVFMIQDFISGNHHNLMDFFGGLQMMRSMMEREVRDDYFSVINNMNGEI